MGTGLNPATASTARHDRIRRHLPIFSDSARRHQAPVTADPGQPHVAGDARSRCPSHHSSRDAQLRPHTRGSRPWQSAGDPSPVVDNPDAAPETGHGGM